ncbi:MAG: hypothetical protein RSD40_04595 [Bacilli bacterium]
MKKATHAMLDLLKAGKNAEILEKYILFDSRFSSPSTLHPKTGFEVIGTVKKTPKMFFCYNGEDMSLVSVFFQLFQ